MIFMVNFAFSLNSLEWMIEQTAATPAAQVSHQPKT